MKITISVPGRFHLFYLAQQLLKKNHLHKLITSYPKFEVIKYGIPKDKINSIIIDEIIWRSWNKLPYFVKNFYNPEFFFSETFDKSAAKRIEISDVFVGCANFSLHSVKKAKQFNSITIIERGSSHILHQQKTAREEYGQYGIKIKPVPQKIVEKAIKEYEETDYISIPSLFVKRTFLKYGIPENKLIHIPYGVDLSQFKQAPKNDKIFRIIFAGGLTLIKGVHYLLQAFAELRLLNSELLLIGSMTNEIKPFFKKYNGCFRWIDKVPQSELYKYYSQGSVFVLNSIDDGFGMVIIQAMACGLPVICTTNTGGEDVINNGIEGYIIPIRDVDKLKEKLLYLYEHPDIREQMSQTAKVKAREKFTWDNYGEKTILAYQKILSRKE